MGSAWLCPFNYPATTHTFLTVLKSESISRMKMIHGGGIFMKYRRALRAISLVLIVLILSCTTVFASSVTRDSDGTYTSAVLNTSKDAGKLTARFLCTTGSQKVANDVSYAGDCTVYTSPEGLVMVVDASNSWNFNEIDLQLQQMGVDTIDIFVASHPHVDHIGSFVELASKYKIGRVYKNSHEYTTNTYYSFLAKIQEQNITCETLYTGDSFMFGDQVLVKIYGPDKGEEEGLNAGSFMDSNDLSLAMKITYKDSSFWTSGDIYITKEMELVERFGDELNADVMKMNHHGYETSSRKEFIEAISPKVAVQMHSLITSKTVAMKYSLRYKALTFYTGQDGTVSISTSGDGKYDIQTQYIRQITNIYGKPAVDGHYSI